MFIFFNLRTFDKEIKSDTFKLVKIILYFKYFYETIQCYSLCMNNYSNIQHRYLTIIF